MMMSLGHEVYLYASEENEAQCTELITCIKKIDQPMEIPVFAIDTKCFLDFNNKVIEELKDRVQQQDFLCLIGGLTQEPIANAYPNVMAVEIGIGYGGAFAKYKVFESYAWMHMFYGVNAPRRDIHLVDGSFYDAVIPNYFDVSEFPYVAKKKDYLLYIGRMIDRKGVGIAADIAKKLNMRLILAGSGPQVPEYGEYVGSVGPEKRGELMSNARAVLVPTQYIEPFGGVAVEAMMCGTPVITTDFGAFTETVIDKVTGFRCHNLKEFTDAVEKSDTLDYEAIRAHAVNNYSTDVIKYKYEDYFKRLLTLYGDGWYAE